MKKDLIVKKMAVLGLGLGLASSVLSGCNKQVFDVKYSFNKALVFEGDSVTIIEIEKWCDYDGEQIQIVTKDDLVLVTSTFDTKLVYDADSDYKAEDLARDLVGENVEIKYYGQSKGKTLTK